MTVVVRMVGVRLWSTLLFPLPPYRCLTGSYRPLRLTNDLDPDEKKVKHDLGLASGLKRQAMRTFLKVREVEKKAGHGQSNLETLGGLGL